jgi:hypothetical protein
MPGRAHKAQLEAWVSGWSADIGELGDETYCACADSTAAADGRHSPPLTQETPEMTRTKRWLGERRSASDCGAESERGRQKEDATATPTSARSNPIPTVCQNCSRQPSPSITPDQEFVFPPTSGVEKIALRCKLVWKKIVDSAVRRQSPDKQGRGRDNDRPANTPISQAGEHGGYDEEDDEDDEVEVDKLSGSSKDGAVRRVGDDIAERQARLRRAERLLRKESRKMREAG